MEKVQRGLENAINSLAGVVAAVEASEMAAIVSAICSVISLVAIVILLIERKEKKRPYLQVSFELVKSSLVCLVIRNVGETPAQLKSFSFNPDFVKQLPAQAQKSAQNRENLNISIHPKQQWVLCLDVITPEVLKYQNTQLEVTFTYTAKGKRRKCYKETEIINFNDYSGFLVYISEVDELREEVKKLTNTMNTVSRELRKLTKQQPLQVQTTHINSLSDVQTRAVITGVSEHAVLTRDENKMDIPSDSEPKP